MECKLTHDHVGIMVSSSAEIFGVLVTAGIIDRIGRKVSISFSFLIFC